jgi:uncharacterized protein YdeI (YjbR/CyaY-like superfamily)
MPKNEQIFDIPDDLRALLQNEGMLEAFELRPFDQQKGYVHWLQNTKGKKARAHNIICLIEELRAGVYLIPAKEQ